MTASPSTGAASSAGSALPNFPLTSTGKRNWAWAAVHPGEAIPSHDTVPEAAAGEGGSFSDLIDIINPLQHIPIVSSIYRALTGDTIGGPARILGGLLFGGPLGFAAGIGTTIAAQVMGGDPGTQIMASVLGTDSNEAAQASTASSSGFRLASAAYSRSAGLTRG